VFDFGDSRLRELVLGELNLYHLRVAEPEGVRKGIARVVVEDLDRLLLGDLDVAEREVVAQHLLELVSAPGLRGEPGPARLVEAHGRARDDAEEERGCGEVRSDRGTAARLLQQ
jgi:hypothetical protein